mgnify:CR=1 FL=1
MQFVGKAFAHEAAVLRVDAHKFRAGSHFGDGIYQVSEGATFSPGTLAIAVADGLHSVGVVDFGVEVGQLEGGAGDAVSLEDEFSFVPELQVVELGFFHFAPEGGCLMIVDVLEGEAGGSIERAQRHYFDRDDAVGSLFDVVERLAHVVSRIDDAGGFRLVGELVVSCYAWVRIALQTGSPCFACWIVVSPDECSVGGNDGERLVVVGICGIRTGPCGVDVVACPDA